MTNPIRIAINGFGRIGRTVLRQLLTNPAHSGIEIVAINDIAPLETCAYLFRYDSVFGPFSGEVQTSDGYLTVNGQTIPFSAHADLTAVDLSGVDVLLECTGRAKTPEIAQAGINAGAANVLISGPSPAAQATVVLGANEADIGDARIISNASCTTNAIAPLLHRLDQTYRINTAHITTIHCYTGSQPSVDVPGADLARSRAAAVSMVPTSTSAAHQITEILPSFAGRLSVSAVRVPVISVSSVDATLQLAKLPDDPVASLKGLFSDNPVVGLTNDPCVSTDMRARPESLILALPETLRTGDAQLRLFGWYDNEWGFSARMIDMTRRIATRGI